MQDARATTDNPSRRRLIAGGSAALLAGAAIATSAHGDPKFPAVIGGDDAEIERLFTEWLPLRRRYRFLEDRITEMDDMHDIPGEIDHELRHVVVPAQHDLAEKIAGLRATTLEGLRAKAAVLLGYVGYHENGESPLWDNHDELMGWSIARDLLGDAAATAEFVA
jgi:hypothetical protein